MKTRRGILRLLTNDFYYLESDRNYFLVLTAKHKRVAGKLVDKIVSVNGLVEWERIVVKKIW